MAGRRSPRRAPCGPRSGPARPRPAAPSPRPGRAARTARPARAAGSARRPSPHRALRAPPVRRRTAAPAPPRRQLRAGRAGSEGDACAGPLHQGGPVRYRARVPAESLVPTPPSTLVTGATGFVGSAVARALLARGHALRLLVRRGSDRRNIAGLDAELVEGDLVRADGFAPALDGCGALFHVAADYRLWVPDPERLMHANVDGTRALMRA